METLFSTGSYNTPFRFEHRQSHHRSPSPSNPRHRDYHHYRFRSPLSSDSQSSRTRSHSSSYNSSYDSSSKCSRSRSRSRTPLRKTGPVKEDDRLPSKASGQTDNKENVENEIVATVTLDEETIRALGERIITDREYSDPVQEDLALRVMDIVMKGLSEKEKKELVERFAPPINCKIYPPLINAEVKAGRDTEVLKRDTRIAENQKKSMAALTALMKGITILLNQASIFEKAIVESSEDPNSEQKSLRMLRDDKIAVVELLGPVYRLLADIHFDASMTRRSLLLGNMYSFSAHVKDEMRQTKVDEYLFGPNLLDVIKNAKQSENATRRPSNQQNSSKVNPKNSRRPFGNKPKNYPFPSSQHTMSAPKHSQSQSQHRQKPSNRWGKQRQRSRRN